MLINRITAPSRWRGLEAKMFDDFVEQKIFVRMEARPALTLLVIVLLYIAAFVFGWIPR